MSSQMKFSLLALVSAAAAVPHYGQHSRFHHKPSGASSGRPYPSGGWGGFNSTQLPLPTGTGLPDELTTTIHETLYSTQTIVSTIYASRPAGEAPGASSVVPLDVSSGAPLQTGGAQCGPETVYVTATNKVTVTVPAGGASSSVNVPSSAAEGLSTAPLSSAPASSAPAVSVPGGGYAVSSISFALPSSSAVEGQLSTGSPEEPAPVTSTQVVVVVPVPSSAPVEAPVPSSKPVEAPVPSSAPVEAPVPTSAPAPVSSAAPQSSAPAPASSAAPIPSNPPTSYSGQKRGLAFNDAQLCSEFDSSKFGFTYNWGSTSGPTNGIPYAPMIHRPELRTPDQWLGDVAKAVAGGSKVVMGFNEPDHAQQANLSPEQACADWKNYMDPIAAAHPGVTILGPSVTNGPAPMGLDWLSRFTTACPSAKVDATNIHFYDQYDDKTVERFIAQVEKAHSQFGKAVWVTEFGLNPGTASQEQAAQFLKGAMQYMDGTDKVQGYSYFMVGTGENQLNAAGGLSLVGQAYVS